MQGLRINKRTAALAAGLLLGGTASASHAAPTRPVTAKADAPLARALAVPARHGWASAIVRTREALTVPQQAQLRQLGADVTRHLSLIGSLELRVPARNLARLAALPFVTHLSSDGTVTKCDRFNVPNSGADVAWKHYGVSGTGVNVAVVDSGVQLTQDLQGSTKTNGVVQRVTFVPGPANVNDECGHGTHVAGIVAGNGYASTGVNCTPIYGIAPHCGLVSVKVLDAHGAGTVGQVVAGVQWVVANAAKYHIRVMNLSLGHPVGESYTTDPLCQAVEAAYKAGIVVVCAAGNEGRLNGNTYTAGLDNEGWGTAYGSISSPGNDPYVITVGAMKSTDTLRADDRIATYSGRGPSRLDLVLKPDLVAPGNRVVSIQAPNAFLSNTYGTTNSCPWAYYYSGNNNTGYSNAYMTLSGTSMAAPVVAGAAALMLQKDPTLTPDTVKARLMLSADKWADPLGNADPLTYGAGYLDIPAALACTAVAGQPAMSPGMSVDAAGNVYVNMDRALWGKSSLWSTGSLTDLRAIWGKFAIAGTSANVLSGSRAVWGKSVWSDRAIWGSSSGTASSVDLSSVALNGEN